MRVSECACVCVCVLGVYTVIRKLWKSCRSRRDCKSQREPTHTLSRDVVFHTVINKGRYYIIYSLNNRCCSCVRGLLCQAELKLWPLGKNSKRSLIGRKAQGRGAVIEHVVFSPLCLYICGPGTSRRSRQLVLY